MTPLTSLMCGWMIYHEKLARRVEILISNGIMHSWNDELAVKRTKSAEKGWLRHRWQKYRRGFPKIHIGIGVSTKKVSFPAGDYSRRCAGVSYGENGPQCSVFSIIKRMFGEEVHSKGRTWWREPELKV